MYYNPRETEIYKRFRYMMTDKNNQFYEAIVVHNLPRADNPNIKMWMEYALSTNTRGRNITGLLEKYINIKDKNCLDVGCAYGGMLIAMAEKGAAATGIDICEDFLRLAQANFTDNNIKLPVYVKDITNIKDIECFINSMDIVTCNDVIEHVKDPELTIKNISSILKKGAALFHIPNKNYPDFVIKDGHKSMFGITLLDYEDASKYYSSKYKDDVYGVYYYLLLSEYREIFIKYGLSFEILKESFTSYDRKRIIDSIYYLKNSRQSLLQDLPQGTKEIVSMKLDKYIEKAIDDISKMNEDDFKNYYGASFWYILGRK